MTAAAHIHDTTAWLPTSVKEVEALGWDYIDVILFTGDAYVDHPSFGTALLGRVLQSHGYRVAIVPQPGWKDDLRDFRKLGKPRLFFGVSAGAMDSMVNHYTAARRRRSDDAYTPDGRHGMRPDYPTIVYSDALKSIYPDVPVIAGGIEASMRRLTHYDYWSDSLKPSILAQCRADALIYGMGELPILEVARRLAAGATVNELADIPQLVTRVDPRDIKAASATDIVLAPHKACLADKRTQALNFKHIEEQSNLMHGATLWQQVDSSTAVRVNPMYPPMETAQLDAAYDLPYTRLPHPRYKGKRIPAYEMIRHSVTMHRGCFGGCAFCTISAHQGKFIASRSPQSIMREVKAITAMPDFKGYISDLGGPSANMYSMHGRNLQLCERCRRPSCLHPTPCPNLNTDHTPLLELYRKVDATPGVKKSFVGSGVRYDLSMHPTGDSRIDAANLRYNRELIARHVSGRLKVAPEHTEPHVLKLMRKPPFELYGKFKQLFDDTNRREGLDQQLIPYFISSHPGCHEQDMARLAVTTRSLGLHLEQVQDFTPTPMTLSTEMYYTGINPYTGEKVYTANTPQAKAAQRQYFFWYDPANRDQITRSLHRIGCPHLIKELFPGNKPSGYKPARASKPQDKAQSKSHPTNKAQGQSHSPNKVQSKQRNQAKSKPSHK